MFIEKMSKVLIIGSAPYMSKWNHLQWFIDNEYEIATFNNSWKLVPDISKVCWHSSTDHRSAGTYVPNKDELQRFRFVKIHKYKDPHLKLYEQKHTTMFFNVLYYYLFQGVYREIVVIGCDMTYKSPNGDTFYSNEPNSKAKNDPLNQLGETGLTTECTHAWELCQMKNVSVYNASKSTETRLLFPRFKN